MNEVIFDSNENIANIQQNTEDINVLLDVFWHIFYSLKKEEKSGISVDKISEIAMEMVKIYYSEI